VRDEPVGKVVWFTVEAGDGAGAPRAR